MVATKNEIVKKQEVLKSYNLLNVSPVKLVSDTGLKSTDKDIKELKALFSIIMTSINAIDFLKENDIIHPHHFGVTGYNTNYYEIENTVACRIYKNLTPKFIRDIDNYNNKVKLLASKNVLLPKDISIIDYERSKINLNKTNEFTYINPNISEYSTVLNSRMFSNISDLTKLADIFGFVIMPLSIAKDTIYSCDPFRDSRTIKNAVSEYRKFNSNKELYVLCPLDFYDLMQHAKSEKYHQVYFPKTMPYIGMNIGMSLPVFRTIFESVGILDQRVTKLENNVESIKKQLVSIENNIKIIQNEVSKLAQAQVALRMQMIEQEKNFKQYKLEMQQQMARMIDPLLFSVEKSIEDFEVATPCELAFAWGAEFPEAFIDMLGIKSTNEVKNIWLK